MISAEEAKTLVYDLHKEAREGKWDLCLHFSNDKTFLYIVNFYENMDFAQIMFQ